MKFPYLKVILFGYCLRKSCPCKIFAYVASKIQEWLESKCLLNLLALKVLATVSCPHCHQLVNSQAISCPYCRTTLKAYGHPGIPLHRATGGGYLCDTCTYHADDTCNFPRRPYAKDCTLYQNIEETKLELEQQRHTNSFVITVKSWVKRNQALLLLLSLLLVCLLFVILRS